VEAIVATTSRWLRDRVADWRIHQTLDAYGQVVGRLLEHEPGYPSEEELRAVVSKGIEKYGFDGVGAGCDSDGSERLCVTDTRTPPLTRYRRVIIDVLPSA
jgi:hypothetical protein